MSKVSTLITCAFLLIPGILSAQSISSQSDRYAKIGNQAANIRSHLLEEKLPPVLPDIFLPGMKKKKADFVPIHIMDTPDELQQELIRMRKKYLPFLNNYAPKMQETRERLYFKKFNWRIETPEDRKYFDSTLEGKGNWIMVNIPHYGPPVGRKTTFYYKEFKLTHGMLNYDCQFICFKGVDYRAKIFLNDVLVGEHEGFFAPFECNITDYVTPGINRLLIQVENDYTTHGSAGEDGKVKMGEKIYAVGGLGWDNPEVGWHICPPGMGIYQDCYIEARNTLHIHDVFIRPLVEKDSVDVFIEINNESTEKKDIRLLLDLYGQNFKDTILQNIEYIPSTIHVPGVGDLAKPTDWQRKRLAMGYGINYLRFRLPLPSPRLWNNDTPYLYQLQTRLFDNDDNLMDTKATPFGMRSFRQDTLSYPKGRFYLNGEKIRLRGANTMGFLQNDVKNKNRDQLIDDILLAKICHLNFLRLTQRPVQPEIYEYCDKLGMMLQTDLPLFGTVRPHLFPEALKQAGEMERLVRNHPSNILITYINERFPNGEGKPQRSISRAEDYSLFFKANDQIVHFWNPDRVIKACDGDYDPPAPGMPDNHCYNGWYNGHGLELGDLHKGYWQKVKPGWFYGCGEFGSEALDNYETILKHWPKEWLPKDLSAPWKPDKVVKSQTYRFHYMWYPTPSTLPEWIEASQDHQAWVTRLTTEAFRRDTNMMSFAIHLFIDAWPAGWMKAIMDVDRTPKKAFFTYRKALAPVMVNLRTDRYKFFTGEEIQVEAWLCNDLNTTPENNTLKWQLEKKGKILCSAQISPNFPLNSSRFQGYIKFTAPKVSKRTDYRLRLALFDAEGKGISESLIDLEVFPDPRVRQNKAVFTPPASEKAKQLLTELKIKRRTDPEVADIILIDNFNYYKSHAEELDRWVEEGKILIFLELPPGEYKIGESRISVEKTIMGRYYFVSPMTGHPLVKDAEPFDFRFWYNEAAGRVTPFLGSFLETGPKWSPVLKTGKTTWTNDGGVYYAAAEMKKGKGAYRICQLQLTKRTTSNPTARSFAYRLLGVE